MTTLNQHLDIARSNIRGDEELLRHILSQIPEQKGSRHLLSPYVTYILTTSISAYALLIISLPIYNDYVLYRADNAIDKELMALDQQADSFEQQMNQKDIAQFTTDETAI